MEFLGAGASMALGYPSTVCVWERVRRLAYWAREPEHDDHRRFRELAEYLPAVLGPRFGGSDADGGPTILDVLTLLDSAVDDAHTHTVVDDQTKRRVSYGPDLLRVVRRQCHLAICAGVARDFADYAAAGHWNAVEPAVGAAVPAHDVITTNWDTAVERAVFVDPKTFAFDLGLDVTVTDKKGNPLGAGAVARTRRLYKLHGSVNWLRCPVCSKIWVNNGYDSGWIGASDSDMGEDGECDCPQRGRLEACIASPSFARSSAARSLAGVWNGAREALVAADRWIVRGYSAPIEDHEVRTLFLEAAMRRRGLRRDCEELAITVINPSHREVVGRLTQLLSGVGAHITGQPP